eukprot:gene9259-1346_t
MPGGIHLFIGYLLTLLFNNEKLKYGIMIGSILPDIDLPLTIIMTFFHFLVTGGVITMHYIDFWHRSLTHSVFTILMIFLVFSSVNSAKTYYFNRFFGIGLCLGMLFHSLSDVIYLKGVLLMFPFQTEEYFFELDFGLFFRFEKYSLLTQKLLLTVDHLTDCIFYYFIIGKNKKHYSMIYNLMWIQSSILMILMSIVILIPSISLEVFAGILYFFALVFVCFNIYSPIYIHQVQQEITKMNTSLNTK